MRTYSHALLTWTTARTLRPQSPTATAWAVLGASIPDLPLAAGAAWLAARKRSLFSTKDLQERVCSREIFRRPDAALHSILPVAATLALYKTAGAQRSGTDGKLPAFLFGWAGHAVTDLLTHGDDARPFFWPLSNWRFTSPVSYRETERHARLFTIIEHAAILAATSYLPAGRRN